MLCEKKYFGIVSCNLFDLPLNPDLFTPFACARVHSVRTNVVACSQLPTSGDHHPGAELTVRELEEMACRQQHQIESQRQLLAAKEQRLRYLKQHDAKHHQVAAEHDRLRRLRDRVEAQEQKLRKLRALRGQVDQTKLNNVTLSEYRRRARTV